MSLVDLHARQVAVAGIEPQTTGDLAARQAMRTYTTAPRGQVLQNTSVTSIYNFWALYNIRPQRKTIKIIYLLLSNYDIPDYSSKMHSEVVVYTNFKRHNAIYLTCSL